MLVKSATEVGVLGASEVCQQTNSHVPVELLTSSTVKIGNTKNISCTADWVAFCTRADCCLSCRDAGNGRSHCSRSPSYGDDDGGSTHDDCCLDECMVVDDCYLLMSECNVLIGDLLLSLKSSDHMGMTRALYT